MTQAISATRMELLARRARIEFARQGRDVLEDKRSALLRELNRIAERALQGSDRLTEHAAEGRTALARALALDGEEAVRSAALAASGEVRLELRTRNVAGVQLVDVESEPVSRAVTDRGYGLAFTSPRIDRVAEAHEAVLDLLVRTAATELSVRRLATEIKTTTRRVNALDQVVVPRLERERDRIAATLDEREREDRVRLRRAKASRQRAPRR